MTYRKAIKKIRKAFNKKFIKSYKQAMIEDYENLMKKLKGEKDKVKEEHMKRINVVIAYKNGRTYTINNVHDIEAFFNRNGDLCVSISYEANVDDLVYYREETKNIVSMMIFEG